MARSIANNPHQFIVNLTGVICNAQDVTVTLTNVQDDQSNTLASASATMGLLLGDVDGDGSVTMADVALVKANLGQTANATNFRSDVNPDGVINHMDLSRTETLGRIFSALTSRLIDQANNNQSPHTNTDAYATLPP